MSLEFTRKSLEKLTFVIQTGSKSPKVIGSYKGLESVICASIFFNTIKLTPKGKCLVFGEDDLKYLGYITKKPNGMIEKHKPSEEDENTYFNDWYTSY